MSAAEPRVEGLRRALALRLLAIAAAIAGGLCLQHALAARLQGIEALAREDLLAARAALASLLRGVGTLVFGMTAAAGISLLLSCRKALEAAQFPPPGAWSFGAARISTGQRARRLAWGGLALGAVLVLCSAAGGGLMWLLASRLLACRAGLG